MKTYRRHSHFIDEELREPSSLVDEAFLTEKQTVGIFRGMTTT